MTIPVYLAYKCKENIQPISQYTNCYFLADIFNTMLFGTENNFQLRLCFNRLDVAHIYFQLLASLVSFLKNIKETTKKKNNCRKSETSRNGHK